jgi:hypothetical protein
MQKNPKEQAAMQPFESGQIWRMEDSHVRIGEVGKTLVEYKVLKGDVKRGPIRLTGKPALQDFLKTRGAILQ